MRKMRKGFTLVELLIVIAILGTLSAAMTVSSSTATAKAKAAVIANNLKTCTSGAQVYMFEHTDASTTLTTSTADMLADAVPNFTEFQEISGTSDTIIYAAVDKSGVDKVPDKWTITVTLSGSDKGDIVAALKSIKGFKNLTAVSTAEDDKNKSYVITYAVFAGTATGTTGS